MQLVDGLAGRDVHAGGLPLFLAETLRFLDGEKKLLFQLLEAFVRGQVQAVETEETERSQVSRRPHRPLM